MPRGQIGTPCRARIPLFVDYARRGACTHMPSGGVVRSNSAPVHSAGNYREPQVLSPMNPGTPPPSCDEGFVFTGTAELLAADLMRHYNRGITAVFAKAWNLAGRGTCVLDFGAGMGSVTAEFFARTGVRPIALEIDRSLAAMTRRRGFSVIDSLDIIQPGTLDLVFSSNVLEHIDDDVGAMGEIFHRLRPGGIFAVYVPAFPALYSEHDRRIGHFRRYTRAELARKLRSAGFSVLQNSYRDCIGFLAALLYKALHSRSSDPPSSRQLLIYDKLFVLSRLLDDAGMKHVVGKNLAVIARKATA